MKKILLLFVAVATLASCSKDDPAPTVDPIVGKWVVLNSKTENLEAGIEWNGTAGVCSSLEPLTYNANLTGNWVAYDEEDSVCTYLGTVGFTYENQGQGNYLQREPMDNVMLKVSFSNNNNTMTQVFSEHYYRMTTTYQRQ